MEAPLPLVVYVTPSAIQRLSRHGALKPRWRLEVLEGVGWSLKQRAIGRRWFLSSEIMCIYIYRNMYRMSYVPMVFVGKCHVHTDIEKVFFSNHG